MQFWVKGYYKGKVKGIMDIGRPTTTTEAQAIICMVHYYRDMWTGQYQKLAPLTEAARYPKGIKTPLNDAP